MTDTTAHVYASITKSEKQDDGTLLVTGSVSDDTLDVDQQIADADWLKTAIPAWFRNGGNIREMHLPIAAGVATEYAEQGHTIVAKVVDASSVRKVEQGVLKGFSIGIKRPRVVLDKAASGGRIVGGDVIEVSLVDRPANPSCILTLAKAATPGVELDPADFDEPTGLVKVEELADTELPTPAAEEAPTDLPTAGDISEKAAGVGSPDGARFSYEVTIPVDVAALSKLAGVLQEVGGTLEKRQFDTKQRKRMAAKGQAMPGGGFPIANREDLENAIRAIGRAKDPAAAKAHIKERAKALGESALIPDTWKASLADLVKSVESADETAHDPATLEAVKNGILDCLIAEAREMQGGEDETYDLQGLVQTLALFVQWWRHESWEGEAPSVVSDSDDMDKVATPDSTKATDAGGTITTTATPDTVKSMVAEVTKGIEQRLVEALDERLGTFATRLETVEKMAAPGGPARMRTQADRVASSAGDALRTEISSLMATIRTMDDGAMKTVFADRIKAKQGELDALTKRSPTY